MENGKNNSGCCSCNTSCCRSTQDKEVKKRRIVIDFLFLDLSVFTQCQGTDTSLDEALSSISQVLDATGVEVVINKINVINEELAQKYKFVSSPTIHVNGRDIQMDVRESLCESCGDLCGEEVDCRVWVYQGKEYTTPPKGMIIQAILKEVYGEDKRADTSPKEYSTPQHLKNYYTAVRNKVINRNLILQIL
jgi:hypothetical protein